MGTMKRVAYVAVIAAMAVGLHGAAEPASKSIYDESGNGRALLDAALAKAEMEQKNVLIQFGGNWCGWCHRLQDTFDNVSAVNTALKHNYVLVHIDTRSNRDLVKELAPAAGSVPYLTVLSPDGKVLKNQNTEPLEKDGGHDPGKVASFLDQWKPGPRDAEAVFSNAIATAKAEDKAVFVHFGTPGCGWCRRLEAFLDEPAVAALMQKDYIALKIDLAQMENGTAVYEQYRKQPGGIPWYAIIDGDGKAVITSDGPGGNIGYPVQESEVAHFNTIIDETAKHMTDAEREEIKTAVARAAEQIRASRG